MKNIKLFGVVLLASTLAACGGSSGEINNSASSAGANQVSSSTASSISAPASSSEAASSTAAVSSSENANSSESGASSSAPPASAGDVDFSLMGYANEGFTVTGGQGTNPQVVSVGAGQTLRNVMRDVLFDDAYNGGIIMYLDNGADLQEVLNEQERHQRHRPDDAPKPLTIYITDTITHANSGTTKIDMKRQSSVSIIGDGDKGEFNGIGITLNEAHNVIISNLMIHHVNIGSGTAIEVTNDSSHIWITRNEFYAAGIFYHPDGSINDSYKDDYDGLIDIKRNSHNITVSWNVLRDHYKGMLLGHDDNASLAPNNVTYHHNYFYNIKSRLPLIRFAQVHMFNNYFHDAQDTAINARMGATVLVENNYFENVGDGNINGDTGYVKGPIGHFYGSPQPGYWKVSGNILVNSADNHMHDTDPTISVPYHYTLHEAADIPSVITTHAGRSFISAP